MQKFIEDETESQGGGYPEDVDEDLREKIEQQKDEMEEILNVEMLASPPYSFVNLTSNLIPIGLESTLQDLVSIIE